MTHTKLAQLSVLPLLWIIISTSTKLPGCVHVIVLVTWHKTFSVYANRVKRQTEETYPGIDNLWIMHKSDFWKNCDIVLPFACKNIYVNMQNVVMQTDLINLQYNYLFRHALNIFKEFSFLKKRTSVSNVNCHSSISTFKLFL